MAAALTLSASMAVYGFSSTIDPQTVTPQLAPGNGTLTSVTAPAYATRGLLMHSDANFRGAADQLADALKAYPSADVAEKTRIAHALNALSIPGADAETLLRSFLTDYPTSPWRSLAQFGLGDAMFDAGNYAGALAAYDEVSAAGLSDAMADDLNYRRGFCMLKLSEFQQAEAIYQALTASPRYANAARFYQGYIAYAKGDYAAALKDFNAVRRHGMPCSMAAFYTAQINFLRGNYAQSEKAAKVLLTNPQALAEPEFIAEINRIEGESLWQQGKTAQALPYLQAYVDATEAPLPSASYMLGVEAFNGGQYDRAIALLTRAADSDNAMGQSALLFIGQSYLHQGNNNAATLALDKAYRMRHDPKVEEAALYNLAIAKMQGGRTPFGSSVGLLEEFLDRFPSSAHASEVADYMVSGYMTDNNYTAALSAINRVKSPSRSVLGTKQKVLYTLGGRELQSGKASQALVHLSEAASMKGYDASTAAEALLWKGEAQYATGDFVGAASSLNAYLKQPEGNRANRAIAYFDLGYTRMAQKDFKSAAADFKKYLELSKSTADARQKADAYNRLADSQYYLSQFAEADANYARAYSADRSAGDYPTYQQGIMKGLRRDHQGKISTLENMIAEYPKSALVPQALLAMAESYGELGRTDQAIDTYTILADKYSTTAQGRQGMLLLAITELNSGNRDDAMERYRQVIRSYPSSDEARVAADDLKQLYADDGNVRGYLNFINSVDNAPKPETAEIAAMTLRSAEQALARNRDGEALSAATEIVTIYPDSPQAVEALAMKADIERRQGRTTDALASYRALEQKASDAPTVNAARLGILRTSRDLGDNESVVAQADLLLQSGTLSVADRKEASFTKALALSDLGKADEAVEIWKELATDTDDLTGAKSSFYLAQHYADTGRDREAKTQVTSLIDANPPYDYWLARGFILLSDILRREGNKFEADEYLRSLRENYPGSEADIFRLIDERLK